LGLVVALLLLFALGLLCLTCVASWASSVLYKAKVRGSSECV
jgi:hypothetical protein